MRTEPRRAFIVWAAFLAALLLAWAIYRPELARPFDFIDFPETIIVLKQHDSLVARVVALTQAYLLEARLNLLVYVAVAAKWSMFGWSTEWWQLSRFVVMLGVICAAYALLRQLKLSTLAAMAGASVFLASPPAVRGWVRLSAAEPMVTLFLLLATLLAVRVPTDGTRRTTHGLLVGALGVLIVQSKEVDIVSLTLPLLLLLMQRDSDALGPPRLTRSNYRRAFAWSLAWSLSIAPCVWAFMAAPARSYGRGFGSVRPSLFDAIAAALSAILPFFPRADDLGASIAWIAYLAILIAGLPLLWAKLGGSTHARCLAAVAISLPLLCGLAYSPWPSFQMVYALPFAFGGALLVAVAMDQLAQRSAIASAGAALAWCAVLAYAIPDAIASARQIYSTQIVTAEVVSRLTQRSDADSILVVGPQAVFDARASFAPRLIKYAQAQGRTIAPSANVTCAGGKAALESFLRVIVVWSPLACGAAPRRGESIASDYFRLDWRSRAWRRESTELILLRAH